MLYKLKRFLLLVVIVLFIFSTAILASCSKECEHTWQDATCTEPKVCTKCGETEGEALGHSLEKIAATPATCQIAGNSEYYECSVCHKYYSDANGANEIALDSWVIAPLEHSYGEWIEEVSATCTANTAKGVLGHYHCSVCNKDFDENHEELTSLEIAKLKHIYEEERKDATCVEAGYIKYTCSLCGNNYTEDLLPTGHKWDYDEATCEHGQNCLNCGLSIPALNHSYNEIDFIEATCEHGDITIYECEKCHTSYKEYTGNSLAHDYGEYVLEVVDEKICLYQQVAYCKNCGLDHVEGTIEKHNYTATIIKDATCSYEGEKEYVCQNCGHSYMEMIEVNPDAHVWTELSTDADKVTYQCELCQATKVVIDASAFTSVEVDKSTLEDTAIKLENAEIAVDNETLSGIEDTGEALVISSDIVAKDDLNDILTEEEKAQIGDNPVYNFTITQGENAIAEFAGLVTVTLPYTLSEGEDIDSIAVWYISLDGSPVTINATYSNGYITFTTNHFSYYTVTRLTPTQRCSLYGHSYKNFVVEADCLHDGYTRKICLRCSDQVIEDEVKAYGHNYQIETTKPTCTEPGKEIYNCSNCGYSYEKTLSPLGHNWIEVEHIEPTCQNSGYSLYRCSNCDEEYTYTLAQLEHDYKKTIVPATCTQSGYTLCVCHACNHEIITDYTDQLPHNYEYNWVWSTDYSSATLDVACSSCNIHNSLKATIEVNIIPATCQNKETTIYTATVILDSEKVFDERIITSGELLEHDIVDQWQYDSDYHYQVCSICNEQFNKSEHIFQSGICSVCGYDENSCQHELYEKTINLSDYGCCEGSIIINACDCLEYVYLVDVNTSCDLVVDSTTKTTLNGYEGDLTIGHCSKCNLEIRYFMSLMNDGCHYTTYESYDFIVNGEAIVSNAITEGEYYLHDYIEIELTTECGTTILCGKCECGDTNLNLDNISIKCEDLNNIMPEEIYDEYGNLHITYDGYCSKCGLHINYELYYENIDSCQRNEIFTILVEYNKESYESQTSQHFDEHNYIYSYELLGQSCTDGIVLSGYCDKCNAVIEEYTIYEHRIIEEIIDLSQYDVDGQIIYQHCLCNEIVGSCDLQIKSEFVSNNNYVDELGIEHYVEEYTFSTSDLNITVDRYSILDGCSRQDYTLITLKYLDNTEEYEFVSNYVEHIISYEYQMHGQSCIDGVLVIEICSVCGEVLSQYEITDHKVISQIIDLKEYGIEGAIYISECPCGEIEEPVKIDIPYYDIKTEEIEVDGIVHKIDTYLCDDPNLLYTLEYYEEVSGCSVLRYCIYNISYNGQILLDNYETIENYDNHQIVINYEMYGQSCTDGVRVVEICSLCSMVVNEYEVYDHIQIEEIVDLEEYGIIGVIYFYACPCHELEENIKIDIPYNDMQISTMDIDGITHTSITYLTDNVDLLYTLEYYEEVNGCNVVRYNTYNISYNDQILLDNYQTIESYENHTFEYSYELNGSSCLDGVTVVEQCILCGEIISKETYYEHRKEEVEIDLSLYESEGYIYVVKCACGEIFYDVHFEMPYDLLYTDNSYYDENNKLIHVEVWANEEYGFRAQKSYYEDINEENCQIITYYTYNITAGSFGEVYEYSNYSEHHSYDIEYKLLGENCLDGVQVHYVCKYCGTDYNNEIYHHEFVSQEKIDVSQYNCQCGGYILVEKCACGQRGNVNLDNCLCVFDIIPSTMYVDGVGEIDCEIYKCSVTDPVQCMFAIRKGWYHIKVEGQCVLNHYEIYQLGYNDLTDEFMAEIKVIIDQTIEHNYVYDEVEDKYICSDCGSYYDEIIRYDDQGRIIYEEYHYYFTSKKYSDVMSRHTISEYSYINDIQVETSYYYRTEDFDGNWNQEEFVWENCVRHYITSDSYGNYDEYDTPYHYTTYDEQIIKYPTCTQIGTKIEKHSCLICNYVESETEIEISPICHEWNYKIEEDIYVCSICQLENKNGANGEIVVEDLTEEYGNNENLVVGYYEATDVQYIYYVSLILNNVIEGENDQVILDAVTIDTLDEPRALSVNKSKVILLASELGYNEADYDIRISFVPIGADGSVDYGITFN